MARRVVVHIGPRKTATSYIQRVLQHSVESGTIAASASPVRTRGRLDHNQVPGLIDLAKSFGEIARQADAWMQQDGSDARALLDAVTTTTGDVILSAEALSVLRTDGAHRAVGSRTHERVERRRPSGATAITERAHRPTRTRPDRRSSPPATCECGPPTHAPAPPPPTG